MESLRYPSDKQDVLFLKDIRVLWKTNRLIEFFPTQVMSRPEQINAMMRLAVLFGVLYFATSRSPRSFLPVVSVLTTAMAYEKGYIGNEESYAPFEAPKDLSKAPVMEPTPENPFMNQVLWDEDQLRPTQDPNDPQVQKKIRAAYLKEAPLVNVDDVYQKDDGFQRFYSVPRMDRDAFAKFIHSNVDKDGHLISNKANGMLLNDTRRNRVPFYQLEDQVKEETTSTIDKPSLLK